MEGGFAAGAELTAKPCLLLGLSHDEIAIVTQELCDPLRALVALAVHLSSTAKGLRVPMEAQLLELKLQYKNVLIFASVLGKSLVSLRGAAQLHVGEKYDSNSPSITGGPLAPSSAVALCLCCESSSLISVTSATRAWRRWQRALAAADCPRSDSCTPSIHRSDPRAPPPLPPLSPSGRCPHSGISSSAAITISETWG